MNIERNKMITAFTPIITREQQSIETDIVLPDYFDNISKVLKCNVKTFVEAMTPSADRISVAGIAEISLLYMGEDKKLYNFETEIKYTKVVNCGTVELSDNFFVEQKLISLNYRATGPKKLDVKCVVDIVLNIFSTHENEYISSIDEDGIFEQKKSTEFYELSGIYNKSFSISQNIDSTQEMRGTIRTNCDIEISEKKIMANKMFIKGTCKVHQIGISNKEEKLVSSSYDLPFSEVLDIYGLTEEDDCDIFGINSRINIINHNTEGIQVNIIVSFNVILTNKKCIEYVEDAYSVKNELEASFAELNTISTKGMCLDTLMLSFMADTFIEDSFTVCDSYVDGIIAKYNKDKNTFEISAEFNAILRLSDNSYAYISRTYSNEVKSRKEISFTPEVAEACLLSASALQADDNRIKFIADVNILLWGCNYCKVNVLTDATVSDKLVSSSDGIIIYYADKNERIWDIAKSNGSSAESIKKLNGIADDVLLENKMLIIAK